MTYDPQANPGCPLSLLVSVNKFYRGPITPFPFTSSSFFHAVRAEVSSSTHKIGNIYDLSLPLHSLPTSAVELTDAYISCLLFQILLQVFECECVCMHLYKHIPTYKHTHVHAYTHTITHIYVLAKGSHAMYDDVHNRSRSVLCISTYGVTSLFWGKHVFYSMHVWQFICPFLSSIDEHKACFQFPTVILNESSKCLWKPNCSRHSFNLCNVKSLQ